MRECDINGKSMKVNGEEQLKNNKIEKNKIQGFEEIIKREKEAVQPAEVKEEPTEVKTEKPEQV